MFLSRMVREVIDTAYPQAYLRDMRKSGEPSDPGPIIIVQQMAKHEWIMKLPRITEEVDDRLEEGIDWMDEDPKRAASIFQGLIQDYPEHIDAYHHLALTLDKMGKNEEAFRMWEKAVGTALKLFPPHFSLDHDRLEWGFVENRPFLRLYHSYGLQLLERGQTEDALDVLENLLALNANDNQGARALVVNCHLALKQPERVLSVCRQYPRDAMDQLLYGRVLALFQMGKRRQALPALDLAINCYRLIAEEIVKTQHTKPRGTDERYVRVGSKQQAYLYWEQQGRFWTETPGAIEFVRNRLSGRGKRGRG